MVKMAKVRYAGLILLGACVDRGAQPEPELIACLTLGTEYHFNYWYHDNRG